MVVTLLFASDHGGYQLKNTLIKEAQEKGYIALDLGAYNDQPVDYPDYAQKLVIALEQENSGKTPEQAVFGVLICGTGIGMSIAANRHKGVRAALCHNSTDAAYSRQHNDANILCLGERIIGAAVAKDILHTFVKTPFSGGRHLQRLQKLEGC